MIFNIVEDINYRDMLESQIFEVIEYLINKDEEFSITANINGVTFEPEMPESISKNFSHFTLFTLSNYTYESIILTEKTITFEAGFGSENFGSHVTIPLYAIFQIVIDESILFLNPTATVEKYFQEKELEENHTQRSMNAFTMNKKNKDLLS
ncbi:hypothetical protein ALC152_11260 [Arcobacter sp. 15-2]|uniref:hypothetical protein n=1 Tax=Arcobacter sp. 15-2 TaxID=3374109 RepID=UPI00399D0499